MRVRRWNTRAYLPVATTPTTNTITGIPMTTTTPMRILPMNSAKATASCITPQRPRSSVPPATASNYYFIGADGSSQTGPYLPNQSSDSPAIQLYSGSNPMTGKSVVINWETDNGGKLRLSTYYPDNEYDTDKPYVFTVSENNIVTHVSW